MTTIDLTDVSRRFWRARTKPWRLHLFSALTPPWEEARLVWRVPRRVWTVRGLEDVGVPRVWEGRLERRAARCGGHVVTLRLRVPNYLSVGAEWVEGQVTLLVDADGRCRPDKAWVEVVTQPAFSTAQLQALAKNFHTGAMPAFLAIDALNRGDAILAPRDGVDRLELTGALP